MLLHPKYRTKWLNLYASVGKRQQIINAFKKLFKNKFSQVKTAATAETAQANAPPAALRPTQPRTAFLFGDDYLPSPAKKCASNKISVYLSEQPYKVKDLITWWKANKKRFPRLAKIAFAFLFIPAMNAKCKRVFS